MKRELESAESLAELGDVVEENDGIYSAESGNYYSPEDIDDRLSKAQELYEQGNHEQAIRQLPRGTIRERAETLIQEQQTAGQESVFEGIRLSIRDRVDNAYDSVKGTLDDAGAGQEIVYSSTCEALEDQNAEWANIRQRAMTEGVQSSDGAYELYDGDVAWDYAPEESDMWGDANWMHVRDGSVDSRPGLHHKIHYTSDDPEEVAEMTTLFQQVLRGEDIDYFLKVDADEPYEFGPAGNKTEKHTLVTYINGNDLQNAVNQLEHARQAQGMPESDEYKEVFDPATYQREQGFVTRYTEP